MTHANETDVNEKVSVWAFFDGDIFPIAMNWNRRFVKFEKVILKTSHMVGSNRFVDLICSSQTANFKLEFDSSNYSWRVKKVIALE